MLPLALSNKTSVNFVFPSRTSSYMGTHKNEFKDRFYVIKLSIRELSEGGATRGKITLKVSSGLFIQSPLLIDNFLAFS